MRAYLVQKSPAGEVIAGPQTVDRPQLADGDIAIRVAWSSLNYKDALAATANPAVARKLPHVPGIDLAGAVTESKSNRFKSGDQVLAIGYELGVERWGGWSTECVIPAKFAVPMPAKLDARTAMILGTAGWTAMDCVLSLEERGVTPDKGEVIVTGAGGGVGRIAVMLLADRGYQVAAVTGRSELVADLHAAGASRVVSRTEVESAASPKPLLTAKYAGVIDVVGGVVLAHLLKEIHPHGVAAICGLVGGVNLQTTVHPFILRGVSLIGVDSATPTLDRREAVWQQAAKLDAAALQSIAREVTLDCVGAEVEKILQGQVAGRVLVKLGA